MYQEFDETRIKWAAIVSHVREVTLLGVADLSFWQRRLSHQNLRATDRNGQAQIMIIAAEARFMGVRFRELSFSVQVDVPNGSHSPRGIFLMGAFNTNRLFAFCERRFFSTPYETADVSVKISARVAIQLRQHGKVAFSAQMGALGDGAERTPSRVGMDGWEGPIYFPDGARDSTGGQNLFVGRLHGHTKFYDFDPECDVVTLPLSSECEALQSLTDCKFVGSEWVIREDAAHSKSKTYRRAYERSVDDEPGAIHQNKRCQSSI